MPCLCTTLTLALRLTSLTRIVIAFGPGSRSIVFCTLSNPVAVSCTRLEPGSSLSSESGVLPTNWRSMNTDAPGTSVSSCSDASVGAAEAGAGAGSAGAVFGAALRGASATGLAGVGTGSFFLGTMRGAAGSAGLSAAGSGAVSRSISTTPNASTAMTAAIRIPRFMFEMVHQGRVGAGKAGYSFDPRISRITPIRAQAAGRRPATGAGNAAYKSSPRQPLLYAALRTLVGPSGRRLRGVW